MHKNLVPGNLLGNGGWCLKGLAYQAKAFADFRMHQSHLQDLLHYRLPDPNSRISDLVIWDAPNNLHFYQVPSDADAGLRTTLG